MKSTAELTDIYYKELYPSLEALEKQRTQIVWKLKLYGSITAMIFLWLLAWALKHYGLTHPFVVGIGVGAVAVGAMLYRFLTQEYAKDFKSNIIAPLINAIDSNLGYHPDLSLSQHLFTRSNLFLQGVDRYNGNDYVKGEIEGVKLEFSDVHAEYQTRDSKGRTQWHTIFKGLFLVAEFNKHFKSKTIILPDMAQKSLGSLIGGWLQSMNIARDDLIRLDDPEFEKHFVVYGNDPIEARYILTHSMMKRLLEFQKRLSNPLFVSFVNNHIHVAIATGKDLFEPSVFTSLLDYKQAMEYVNTLKNTLGVVEELKLNEKLWSKT